MWRNRNTPPLLVGLQIGTTTLEISLVVPQNTGHVTSGRSCPEDSPACKKDTCSTMFIAALFIIARSCKEPRYPSREKWKQKMWYNYTMEPLETMNS